VTICLDATPLTMTSGGLPRYVSELSSALVAEYPADQFVLSSDQPFDSGLTKLPAPRNWLQRRWWLYGAEQTNARAGVALFHGTNFAVPYHSRRPTVMTVHDLSPWLNPAWQNGAERVRRRSPRMIQLATMIITPSEPVKAEVAGRFHVPPNRVVVTPLAAASNFRPVPKPSPRPYFVFVGTLEPRKNIPMLLEAWRQVKLLYEVDLVLAGRRREDFPAIKPEPGLRILGETPEADLPELYSNAIAAVYVSEYEGFGLPVLEAMQCGAPVIISRDPALREVAGDGVLRVSNAAELSSAMQLLLDDSALRAAQSARSVDRAARFSWTATARSTYGAYMEAIVRFGR
jgi:glycosyltransferase involved in cell wall biosynthesis